MDMMFKPLRVICRVSKVDTGRWDANIRCVGEAQTENRRISLLAAENTLQVIYHEIGDRAISYHRCIPQRAGDDHASAASKHKDNSDVELPAIVAPEEDEIQWSGDEDRP
jgi:hypothetical protein